MRTKSLLAILLLPACILLLPLVGMQISDEVAWDIGDFAVAWALMVGAGLAYLVATRKTSLPTYRAAVGIALATAFVLVWMTLAVGLVGEPGDIGNLLYVGVLAIGVTGAFMARFQPIGMARALFATAFAQMLVSSLSLIAESFQGSANLLVLNALLVVLFLGSALLFRCAGRAAPGNVHGAFDSRRAAR